jgi:hypothetical protein
LDKGFKLFQPAVEMRAFCPNASECDLQHDKYSEKGLLVAWHESFDAF